MAEVKLTRYPDFTLPSRWIQTAVLMLRLFSLESDGGLGNDHCTRAASEIVNEV